MWLQLRTDASAARWRSAAKGRQAAAVPRHSSYRREVGYGFIYISKSQNRNPEC